MSAEGIQPDSHYYERLDHIVDTQNVSYAAAREILGGSSADSESFEAIGEVHSTGIPRVVEEIPLSSLASSALHVIESTPYARYLKRDGPEIARLVGRGQITVEEAEVLFDAIKKRRAELTAKPKEN